MLSVESDSADGTDDPDSSDETSKQSAREHNVKEAQTQQTKSAGDDTDLHVSSSKFATDRQLAWNVVTRAMAAASSSGYLGML